jgi:hypothetical protein
VVTTTAKEKQPSPPPFSARRAKETNSKRQLSCVLSFFGRQSAVGRTRGNRVFDAADFVGLPKCLRNGQTRRGPLGPPHAASALAEATWAVACGRYRITAVVIYIPQLDIGPPGVTIIFCVH